MADQRPVIKNAARKFGWTYTDRADINTGLLERGDMKIVIHFDRYGHIRWAEDRTEQPPYRLRGGTQAVIELMEEVSIR